MCIRDRYIDDTEAVNKYGIIPKTIIFEDVTEPNNLLRKAKEYFANGNRVTLSNTVKVIDLSLIDEGYESYEIYNSYPLSNPLLGINEETRIVGQTINILSPEESEFVFGDKKTLQSDFQVNTEKSYGTVETPVSYTHLDDSR